MKTTTTMMLTIIVLLMFLSSNLVWAQVKKPVPMPQIQTVGEGMVSSGFNLFAAECSGQTVNGISLSNPTKVLYHFGDSSVPPQYHRSYTITVTKSDAKLVVDSYGNIINESTISITENQFNGILETIRAGKVGKRKAINDNDGCTGGTSESLEIFEGARVLFDADVYHCGTKDYGSLTGNIGAVKASLVSLFPPIGWAQVKKPVPMPQIQTVGEGMVWRRSDNKDEDGNFLPPWKEIQITNVSGFKQKPVVGENVTVIPLDEDIAPLELRIVKAEKKENPCDEQLPALWEVELELIKQKVFFDIAPRPKRAEQYPFDVIVIYPAIRFSNQLRRASLSKNMLPNGVAINTVKAAIDLTDDGKPDVLVIAYCCGNPRKSAENCDYTCGKTFKKIGNTWKVIDTSTPC